MTSSMQVATRRQYHGGCAVAHALDQLGNRWTIPVVKELLFGGMRFSALKSRLPGIGPNVLIQRLTELEEMGLVRKRDLPGTIPAHIYELTELGLGAKPLIVTLARWAVGSPDYEALPPISPASLMILLEAALNPAEAFGLDCQFGISVGQDNFSAKLSRGKIEIELGEPDEPIACISGSTTALCQYVFGGAPIEHLESEGRISVSGERHLVRKLPAIFCTS